MNETNPKMIVRDYLAVDRTKLANQRTFLSIVRTGLYFIVMGLSIYSLELLEEIQNFTPVFFVIGLGVIILGVFFYIKNNNRIDRMYKDAM